MPHDGPLVRGRPSEASRLMLQIERPDNEAPLQFPAVIRNLAAGEVTLEVKKPLDYPEMGNPQGLWRLPSPSGRPR